MENLRTNLASPLYVDRIRPTGILHAARRDAIPKTYHCSLMATLSSAGVYVALLLNTVDQTLASWTHQISWSGCCNPLPARYMVTWEDIIISPTMAERQLEDQTHDKRSHRTMVWGASEQPRRQNPPFVTLLDCVVLRADESQNNGYRLARDAFRFLDPN